MSEKRLTKKKPDMRQNKKKNKLKHIRAIKNRESIREKRKEKKQKLKTNT